MKKYIKAAIGVFAVVIAYINYSRALEFASDAIYNLLPGKESKE